jgi:hypothetical protein
MRSARSALLMLLLLMLLSGFSAWAQTPDSQSSWSTTTQSQSPDNLNPVRSTTRHTQSGNRSLDTQSLDRAGPDGKFVPYQDIEKETVQVNAATVRTTIRTFVRDADGSKTLFQVTEEEKQTSPDGNWRTVRTTSNPAVNGGLQLVQRDVEETRKTGPDSAETKTTTYLPGVDGLAPAIQTDAVEKRTGAHTVETKKTTKFADGSGRWQLGEVKKSSITETGNGQKTDELVSSPDLNGKLSDVSRTVRDDTETAAGQKREVEETYSTDTPGVAPDGNLHLVQRVITSQQNAPNGAQITKKQVERPDPGDPSAGLQITTTSTDSVVPGNSGAKAAVTVSVRDGNGDLQPMTVDTMKSSNVNAVQVQIGPTAKSQAPK